MWSVRRPTPRARSSWPLRLRPQIVLLDVQLPDRDGFAVAARLAQEAQPPQVVLISGRDAGRVRPPGRGRAGARVHLQARPDRGGASPRW